MRFIEVNLFWLKPCSCKIIVFFQVWQKVLSLVNCPTIKLFKTAIKSKLRKQENIKKVSANSSRRYLTAVLVSYFKFLSKKLRKENRFYGSSWFSQLCIIFFPSCFMKESQLFYRIPGKIIPKPTWPTSLNLTNKTKCTEFLWLRYIKVWFNE